MHHPHAPCFVTPAFFKPKSRFFAGLDSRLKNAGMTSKRIRGQLLRAVAPPSPKPLLSRFRILLNLRGSPLLSPDARVLDRLNTFAPFNGLVFLALEFTIPLLVSHHIILLIPPARRSALRPVPLESVALNLVLHG